MAGKDSPKGSAKGGSKGGKTNGTAKGTAKGSAKGSTKSSEKEEKKDVRRDVKKEESRKGAAKESAKGGVKGSGSGKGGGKNGGGKGGSALSGAKTVQEVEAEILNSKTGAEKARRGKDAGNDDSPKQALECKGTYCEVKKHSDMGCAVVTFESEVAREIVMNSGEKKLTADKEIRPEIAVNGLNIQMRAHFDKVLQREVKTDIFVAWGRQAEKQTPLSAASLVEAIDKIVFEAQPRQPVQQKEVMPVNMSFGAPGAAFGTAPPVLPSAVPKAVQGMAPPVQQVGPGMMPNNMPLAQGQTNPSSMGSSIFDYMNPSVFSDYMAQNIPGLNPGAQSFSPPQQPNAQQVAAAAAMAAQAAAHAAAIPPQGSVAMQHPFETPPRMNGDHTNGLRADAPAFTPPPLPGSAPLNGQGHNGANGDMDPYAMYNNMMMPERKALKIVDPKNGEVIEAPKVFEAQTPKRKPLMIKDPNDGSVLETLGLNFKPPEPKKPLSIVDPNSGTSIQI